MVKLQHVVTTCVGLLGMVESKDSPRQRAKVLMKKMTWEEKIAQMGSIRRLLKLGPEVDEENYNSRYELQHGTIGKIRTEATVQTITDSFLQALDRCSTGFSMPCQLSTRSGRRR